MYLEQTRNNILDYLHRTCRMGVCKTENLTKDDYRRKGLLVVAKDHR